jgi:hypothetical protein
MRRVERGRKWRRESINQLQQPVPIPHFQPTCSFENEIAALLKEKSKRQKKLCQQKCVYHYAESGGNGVRFERLTLVLSRSERGSKF